MNFADIEVGDIVRSESYSSYRVVELVTALHKWRQGETQPALKVETAYLQPGEKKKTLVVKEENSYRWTHRQSAKHGRNVKADCDRSYEALLPVPGLFVPLIEALEKAQGRYDGNRYGNVARNALRELRSTLKDIEEGVAEPNKTPLFGYDHLHR